MPDMKFSSYFYGDEAMQFTYFRIPCQLITHPRFKHLSTDSKLLYGMLLDRMSLSIKNEWYDDTGRVYIYYTVDEVCSNLNCGRDKAMRLLAELDTGKGVGLIERKKQGQGNKEYSFQRLYRNLYNPELYYLAYQNIYAKEGNMTEGSDGKTIDGMSAKRIDRLIASLKDHSYHPNPARRTYIQKNNNPQKKRPLGIPSFDDKLLQEVVRMILESIYEGNFSRHSHGFRPNHSCHTALMEVKHKFIGTKWFIEGDIKGCFDNVDHAVLINLLRRRIKDEYFISLIWKFLKAGYMEDWVYYNTYSGTPQGSIISPILANIYLHELDCYMEQLSENFHCGKVRRRTSEYQKQVSRMQYLHDRKYGKDKWESLSPNEKQAAMAEMKETRAKMLSVPASDPMDENFRRLVYVRYADDFLIGVIGSQQDAFDIKNKVGAFLKENLHLEMSEEKTLITHAKKDKAHFLGYEIFVCDDQTPRKGARGKTQRVMSGQVMLYVPKEKWMNKLFSYQAMRITYDPVSGKEIWKSIQRKQLLHLDDLEILRQYNAEIRGLYNYYKIANNATVLNAFGYMMKYSMYKTLAAKYHTKVKKIREKYRIGKDFGIRYETKSGMKTALFYNEGFRRQTEVATGEFDMIVKSYFRTSPCSLIQRLKARKCEWCEAENVDLEVHHIRRLKDLKGKALWERAMIGRRRKTMVLCTACHDLLHAGKLD